MGRTHRAGTGILTGTDASNPYCFPGFGLHDELGLLVEAGLTPLAALQTVTLNPVRYFGILNSLGTVETGKLADLVLLDADSLADWEYAENRRAAKLWGRGIMGFMRARAFYVAFDVFPRPKGSSSHIASMVAALTKEFAPVCVLCLGDGELPLYQVDGAVEIHRLPGSQRDVLHRATAFAQFVEFHSRRHAETLELVVFRDPWGGIPAMRGTPGCPSIFEVNALPSWELAYSRPGFAESATLPAKLGDMERRCLRDAAAVLCVSAVTRRALMAEGVAAERIVVIPNAANDIYFNGASQPCPIEELAEGSWCGYVGGLQSWQGVEFLIDAFARTASGRLLIVHSGNRETRGIERRVERHHLGKRVLLHGPLAPDALAGVFARLRFTVAPLTETARNTWQGCCPVKIVESMAAGTPVIASDLAVSRELIRDGLDGLLVTAGDKRAWALALERLFCHQILRDTLAANAFFTARDHFSQPIAHEQLNAVFRAAATALPVGGLIR